MTRLLLAIAGPVCIIALTQAASAFPAHAYIPAVVATIAVFVSAVATLISGVPAGILSAAFAMAGVAHLFNRFDADRITQISLPLLTFALAAATSCMIGWLKKSVQEHRRHDHLRHAPLRRLAHALHETDVGIVLLDRDTRAEFINRTFRKLIKLPDEKADMMPPLIALLYHCRDNRVYDMPDDAVGNFIARQVDGIRTGNLRMDVRLASGTTVRMTCRPLADGGRLLSFVPITDLNEAAKDAPFAQEPSANRSRIPSSAHVRLAVHNSPTLVPKSGITGPGRNVS